ncbi:hypothetical protein [Geobacter sp. SVR]|uniref:hypothetical protein n=1 Tax=Geobacter sp. SVR TaxID=2495594 RepID=UPI0015668D00|nr:hypothetical protein [Geobacter sp. SVR]
MFARRVRIMVSVSGLKPDPLLQHCSSCSILPGIALGKTISLRHCSQGDRPCPVRFPTLSQMSMKNRLTN